MNNRISLYLWVLLCLISSVAHIYAMIDFDSVPWQWFFYNLFLFFIFFLDLSIRYFFGFCFFFLCLNACNSIGLTFVIIFIWYVYKSIRAASKKRKRPRKTENCAAVAENNITTDRRFLARDWYKPQIKRQSQTVASSKSEIENDHFELLIQRHPSFHCCQNQLSSKQWMVVIMQLQLDQHYMVDRQNRISGMHIRINRSVWTQDQHFLYNTLPRSSVRFGLVRFNITLQILFSCSHWFLLDVALLLFCIWCVHFISLSISHLYDISGSGNPFFSSDDLMQN